METRFVKARFAKTRFVLSGFLFFTTSLADNILSEKQESFVIIKDTKKTSVKISKSKLQEKTCTVFGDQISLVPDINQKISQIQKVLLDHTCKYLESSGECVILKNDKNKIDEILKVAKNFEEKMEDFIQDCDKYLEYLKNLK
ncbi:MAG: hypothetical protein ACD_82C00111G0001 [uncultured bacterium]|jgi:hypothetical protein|nr:MAG: hypothetical protein ACD_82C00111G0001 [uncultured bacterium]KKP25038.1 MAG: hypothetical protein UR12_C0047G0005 [candidate division TM6 bacterium GW2011_GWF2_30_66]